MKKLITFLTTLLFIVSISFSGQAQFLDNTDQASTGVETIGGTKYAAQIFTTGTAITSVEVTVDITRVTPGNVAVHIYNQVLSNPGTLVGTLTGSADPDGEETYTGNIALTTATNYYIVIAPTSGVYDVKTLNTGVLRTSDSWSAANQYRTATVNLGMPTWNGSQAARLIFSIEEGGGLLPVELASFKAIQDVSTIVLKWETASEEQNEGFYVERSIDGENWEILDFIAGAGHSTEYLTYQFTDEYPSIKQNYYRLKQMDYNGNFEYSEVLLMEFENELADKVKIYPNPTTDYLTVENVTGFVHIFNINGQLVSQESLTDRERVRINVQDLPQGIYTISFEDDTPSTTFVKQ